MQAEMNLADLVRDAATDFPAKPALIFQGRTVTFSELDDRADLTAAAFASLGVTKGDRVAVIAGNVPEFIDALYGALRAGAAVSPLNVMLTPANLIANLDQMMSVPALAEAADDVVLLALPLFHIYALNVVLGLCLRTGATAVLVERFDALETARLVARHGVSVLFGAPPMFA